MTLRFVIDAQLPPALARNLLAAGFVAEHVNRVGLGAASDMQIWSYTKKNGAVLMTKDEDFVALANRSGHGPQVVWIKLGNTTNHALWSIISRALPKLAEAFRAGERVIIVG